MESNSYDGQYKIKLGGGAMLTDLNKLKGIDFSKKYVEINNYEDFYEYDMLMYQKEMVEYVDLENYSNIKDAEAITDIDFITSYVSYLMYGGAGDEIAIKSQHIRFTEGLEILRYNLRIDDLKKILRKYNLKVSGNKNELISRIEENLSKEQLKKELPAGSFASEYVLTEKGVEYIKKYGMHWYKRFAPPQFSDDEFILLCEKNQQYTHEEILFCLVYQDWLIINLDELDEYVEDDMINTVLHSRYFIASDVIWDIEMTCALLQKNLETSLFAPVENRQDVLFLSRIYREENKYDLALEAVNKFIEVYGDTIPAVLKEKEIILNKINNK